MSALLQTLAIVLAAAALGWTVFFSFVVSPLAMSTLDAGRAKRFIRNSMKRGHPMLAGVAIASAGASALAGALGGGAIMSVSAALYLLAAWALAPQDVDHVPGERRRGRDAPRVVASIITVMILLILLTGILLIGLKV